MEIKGQVLQKTSDSLGQNLADLEALPRTFVG